MGNIINLHDDPHVEVEKLLPWYVTGQIDPVDRAKVEGHLASTGYVLDFGLIKKLTRQIVSVSTNILSSRPLAIASKSAIRTMK